MKELDALLANHVFADQKWRETQLSAIKNASRQDKYKLLIQLSKLMPVLPLEYRTEDYQIVKCEVATFLVHFSSHLHEYCLLSYSDSKITQGLFGLVALHTYGLPLEARKQLAIADIFTAYELNKHISPHRGNIFAQLKLYG